MKKNLFLYIFVSLSLSSTLLPILAQNQPPESSVQKALALIAKQKPIESLKEQTRKFHTVVDQLKGARDCINAIGCSKIQSYLVNFALGAAVGFAQKKLLDPSLGVAIALNVTNKLAYAQYIAKDPVYFLRCLTFRGCDEQTKRFAFFWIGSKSAAISRVILHPRKSIDKMKTKTQKYWPKYKKLSI